MRDIFDFYTNDSGCDLHDDEKNKHNDEKIKHDFYVLTVLVLKMSNRQSGAKYRNGVNELQICQWQTIYAHRMFP